MSDKLREAAKMLLEMMDTSPTEFSVPRPVFDAFENLRAALAAETERVSVPVAWIQHHKAGDNLVWDDPGGRRTPLYALAAEKEPRDGS